MELRNLQALLYKPLATCWIIEVDVQPQVQEGLAVTCDVLSKSQLIATGELAAGSRASPLT